MASDRSDGDRDSNISEEVSILAVLPLVFLWNMYRDEIHSYIVVWLLNTLIQSKRFRTSDTTIGWEGWFFGLNLIGSDIRWLK